jgi:LPS-assembly protein
VGVLYARNGVFFQDPSTGAISTLVLQKFPSVEASVLSRMIGRLPLYFSADTSVGPVARRDALIDTPAIQRFDFSPSVEAPVLRSTFFDWSNTLGVRETAYSRSRESQQSPVLLPDSLNRFSFDYSSHFAGPQLQRDFGNLRHVIEPVVDYTYISGANRFQNTVVVDNVDLFTNTNEVRYGIVNRLFTKRELFSWSLYQKYFFDPTLGGAVVPGRRIAVDPLLAVSGFDFEDGPRRFSPIVSDMRFSATQSTSTDLEVDYDTRTHLFRSAGIIGNANRGQFNGGVSYFFTRSSSFQTANNQLRTSFGYGNRLKPGFSTALSFSYDVQHALFQGSVAEVGYSTSCLGLFFEVSQFNIGSRVESRVQFSFTLKNVGSVGTLRPRERLF